VKKKEKKTAKLFMMRLATVLLVFVNEKRPYILVQCSKELHDFLKREINCCVQISGCFYYLSAIALKAGTNQESSPCLMSNPSFLFETRMGRSGRQISAGLFGGINIKDDLYIVFVQKI
jgi:hypothetical protein